MIKIIFFYISLISCLLTYAIIVFSDFFLKFVPIYTLLSIVLILVIVTPISIIISKDNGKSGYISIAYIISIIYLFSSFRNS